MKLPRVLLGIFVIGFCWARTSAQKEKNETSDTSDSTEKSETDDAKSRSGSKKGNDRKIVCSSATWTIESDADLSGDTYNVYAGCEELKQIVVDWTGDSSPSVSIPTVRVSGPIEIRADDKVALGAVLFPRLVSAGTVTITSKKAIKNKDGDAIVSIASVSMPVLTSAGTVKIADNEVFHGKLGSVEIATQSTLAELDLRIEPKNGGPGCIVGNITIGNVAEIKDIIIDSSIDIAGTISINNVASDSCDGGDHGSVNAHTISLSANKGKGKIAKFQVFGLRAVNKVEVKVDAGNCSIGSVGLVGDNNGVSFGSVKVEAGNKASLPDVSLQRVVGVTGVVTVEVHAGATYSGLIVGANTFVRRSLKLRSADCGLERQSDGVCFSHGSNACSMQSEATTTTEAPETTKITATKAPTTKVITTTAVTGAATATAVTGAAAATAAPEAPTTAKVGAVTTVTLDAATTADDLIAALIDPMSGTHDLKSTSPDDGLTTTGKTTAADTPGGAAQASATTTVNGTVTNSNAPATRHAEEETPAGDQVGLAVGNVIDGGVDKQTPENAEEPDAKSHVAETESSKYTDDWYGYNERNACEEALGGPCFNGGVCKWKLARCTEDIDVYDTPVCACPYLGGGECFYGKQCEKLVTSCPQETKACQVVTQDLFGVDPTNKVCFAASEWPSRLCTADQPTTDVGAGASSLGKGADLHLDLKADEGKPAKKSASIAVAVGLILFIIAILAIWRKRKTHEAGKLAVSRCMTQSTTGSGLPHIANFKGSNVSINTKAIAATEPNALPRMNPMYEYMEATLLEQTNLNDFPAYVEPTPFGQIECTVDYLEPTPLTPLGQANLNELPIGESAEMTGDGYLAVDGGLDEPTYDLGTAANADVAYEMTASGEEALYQLAFGNACEHLYDHASEESTQRGVEQTGNPSVVNRTANMAAAVYESFLAPAGENQPVTGAVAGAATLILKQDGSIQDETADERAARLVLENGLQRENSHTFTLEKALRNVQDTTFDRCTKPTKHEPSKKKLKKQKKSSTKTNKKAEKEDRK